MTCARSRSARLMVVTGLLVATALPIHGADTRVTDGAGVAGTAPSIASACLPGERGYFQASLRGALNAQLDWRGATLSCQGGVRPQDRGVRLSVQGVVPRTGERLRINIGMAAVPGVAVTGVAPASVTVIVEGANRIYATQDDTHCAVEALRQDALPAEVTHSTTSVHAYRIAARGYCVDPVPALSPGAEAGRLYIDRFDFAAQASFEPESLHESTTH